MTVVLPKPTYAAPCATPPHTRSTATPSRPPHARPRPHTRNRVEDSGVIRVDTGHRVGAEPPSDTTPSGRTTLDIHI